MRTTILFFFLVSLLVPAISIAQGQTGARQRILLDAGWRFRLSQPVHLLNETDISQWRWKADDNGPSDWAIVAAPGYDSSGADWADTSTGTDIFNGRVGYAWCVTTLPAIATPSALELKVDDNCDVFLNGHKIAHHEGWDAVFTVPVGKAWQPGASNYLAILVQNTDGPGGVDLAAVGNLMPDQTDHPERPAFNDSAWRVVHLPHDYVVEGKFTPTADTSHGSLPTQKAWYRKTFDLPASDRGKTVWIDFDGVYRDSVVWLNGVKLGEFQSGYAPFRYDISTVANFGAKNTLAVSVDPTAPEGWWYEGGGIYRHVWLNIANPIHVAPYGTFVTSKLPEPVPGKPVPGATVTIQTQIASPAGSTTPITLSSEILAPAKSTTGTLSEPVVLTSPVQTITQVVNLSHPILWSIEHPNLYTLKTLLYQNGKVIDNYTTTFGIRTIRFDANLGFFLNGVSVKIKGTCNHQDFAGIGIAVPDSMEFWRVKTLKAMGSNGWRTSHNPPTASLLDACDQLGMVVMDENRHLGNTTLPKTPSGTTFTDPTELDAMILRDRNHPSVIMWSMCNEESLEGSPEGQVIFKQMRANVRTLDTTRPISCAMNYGYQTLNGISGAEDIQGINYNPWDYTKFHTDNPTIPMYGSETASTVSTRGVYSTDKFGGGNDAFTGDPNNGWVSAYDVNHAGYAQTAEGSWQPEAERPYVAGGFIWTGFDYKGEPSPFGWPDINSNFGILDECGFPKDNYYYYLSWWTNKPVVHILPHWNWPGKEGQPIPVWVFSNAATVDLLVNGVSQGRQTMPVNAHVEWSVTYAPGTVVANGYDANGNLIGTDTVQTTGAPASIRLVADRTKLCADGEDEIPVEVDILDAQGRIVPTAGNKVTFTISGPAQIAGVGNGNPSDHDPDKANYRSAFNGKALVVVGSEERAGAIILTATSPGLTSARATFKSVVGSSIAAY
jgi:beta-galactosidase